MNKGHFYSVVDESRKSIDELGNISGREDYIGNSREVKIFDRYEIGRVADSIAEWRQNCCAYAYC